MKVDTIILQILLTLTHIILAVTKLDNVTWDQWGSCGSQVCIDILVRSFLSWPEYPGLSTWEDCEHPPWPTGVPIVEWRCHTTLAQRRGKTVDSQSDSNQEDFPNSDSFPQASDW